MKRAIILFLVALVAATVLAVALGGFFALTFGAVVAAVIPPRLQGQVVESWVCPDGSHADLDTIDSQCNAHNRNSGTCQQIQIDCVNKRGKLVKEIDPNTSTAALFGVMVLYMFGLFGGGTFLLTFVVVLIAGGGILKAVSSVEESQA